MTIRTILGAAASVAVNASAVAHDLSRAPEKPRGVLPPETLETIDLAKEIPGMAGRQLRMRRLTLEPGGAIPPHSHVDRPEIVFILQGRVRDHRSDRDAPVEYGAGETLTQSGAVHHWLENIGDEPLIGLAVDIANLGVAQAFTAEQILKAYGRAGHDAEPHRHKPD